jgi:hypothetical protein
MARATAATYLELAQNKVVNCSLGFARATAETYLDAFFLQVRLHHDGLILMMLHTCDRTDALLNTSHPITLEDIISTPNDNCRIMTTPENSEIQYRSPPATSPATGPATSPASTLAGPAADASFVKESVSFFCGLCEKLPKQLRRRTSLQFFFLGARQSDC